MENNGSSGVFDTRISQLEQGQRDLSADINAMSGQFERTLKSAVDSFGRQMDALSAKVDERSKIPWPALGVMLSFITVIGGLVWYPVKDKQDKMEMAIVRLSENMVSDKELETRLKVTGDRRDDNQRAVEEKIGRMQRTQEENERKIVPLEWHKDKWGANDRELAALRDYASQNTINLQRQVDDIKRTFGDTFSLRDALQQMQRRIDALESSTARPTK